MNILITGVAGFIGFHVAREALKRGDNAIGIGDLNDYYDPSLKEDRLKELKVLVNSIKAKFSFIKGDISEQDSLRKCFDQQVDRVINLAAQAGVRRSLEDPQTYVRSNLMGFVNVLEECRYNKIEHLTYASTSSVYGLNGLLPFSEKKISDHPIQLYAATKRSNELLAHSYSHLFNLPTTGLRFFTVYGPWGRPDMAYFLFADKIMKGEPIEVFNHGKMRRDFTYIDDIVEGVFRVMNNPPKPKPNWNGNPSESFAPYRIYNIGNNQPVELLYFIEVLENALGKKAIKKMLPIQPGDVPETYAYIDDLVADVGFKPSTSIEEGIGRFTDWFKWYYKY